MMKIKKIIIGITIFLITTLTIAYYSTQKIMYDYVQNNLGIEYEDSQFSIMNKELRLKNVFYLEKNKKDNFKVSAQEIKIEFEKVFFENKKILIKNIDIINLKFENEIKTIALKEKMNSQNLIDSDEKLKKVEDDVAITAVEAKKKNFLSRLKGALNNNQEDKEYFVRKINELKIGDQIERIIGRARISEGLDSIDIYINKKLNEKFEEDLYEISKEYPLVVDKIKRKIESENNDKNTWKIDVENMNLEVNIYNINFKGSIKNISNMLSTLDKNIVLNLIDGSGMNKIYIEYNLTDYYGKITVTMKDVDTKNINGFNKYFIEGKIDINKTTNINLDEVNILGNLKIKNSLINVENEEVMKNLLGIEDEKQIKIIIPLLKGAVSEVRNLNADYYYNSKERKIMINTDIKERIEEKMFD